MGNQNGAGILVAALILSIIALFTLVAVFIIVSFKKKNESQNENSLVSKKQEVKPVHKNIEPKVYTTEDIKKFMEFDEIKDNMIVQKDGKKLVMVMQCKGINYDLMSSIEKVGVEQGFVQFLNTLTRPIQLYVQSRKVNLEESLLNYRKRLKTIEQSYNKIKFQYEQALKNEEIDQKTFKNIKTEYIRLKNLYEYTQDIIDNTETMSLNKNILTKNYYIAIHYYPDNAEGLFKKEEILDMAFSELYTNAQAMLRALSACDISGKVLNSTELADLLYVAYNRDESEVYGIDKAIKAGYDSLYTTAPDVINKKVIELDRIINERAMQLANDTVDKVALKSRRQKELELKEKNMDDLISSIAQSIINENKNYISKEIAEESINEITKNNKKRETKKKETKKKENKKEV